MYCFFSAVGLSHGVSEDYGTSHRMYLDPNVHSIEFKPVYKSEVTVLWKRDEPPASFDSRKHVIGSYYVINNLTQRDSGRYILKDKNQRTLSTKTIDVKGEDLIPYLSLSSLLCLFVKTL